MVVTSSVMDHEEEKSLEGRAIFVDVRSDSQELVVFRHAIRARRRTGFDLPRSGAHGKVCDGDVF